MTDQEYVVQSFARCFNKYKDKKIVLYGVGVNTKAVLESFPETSIIGLMDKTRTGQFFYGKKVLSFDEIVLAQTDIIVVVARISSAHAIYYRLHDFCSEHGIALSGINGRDLFELFGYGTESATAMGFFSLTEVALRQTILQQNKVCFAVEDTLLLMKTWSQKDFLKLLQSGEGDITSRYCRLVTPRKKMLEILAFAREQGKRIVLFYQGCLSEEQIKVVLQHFEILDEAEILSDVAGLQNGLYIGTDTQISQKVRLQGGTVFQIKSAREMGDISSYRCIGNYLHNLNDRSLAACFLAAVFNNPFALAGSDGRCRVTTAYELGYFFLGPLSTAAVLWFIEMVRKGDYAGILFGSRDGYLMQKLYRRAVQILQYEELPEDWYFHVSRMLCWKAMMETKTDMLRIWREMVAQAPELVLQKIFGLATEEIETYYAGKFGEDEVAYFLSYKDRLLEIAAATRKNYEKYIARFDLQAGQRYAFFDFVSRGACQHWLGKLVPCKLEGLYVCRHHRYDDPEPESENITGYFEEFQNYMPDTYLFAHMGDAEFTYTSPEPSIYNMDAEGNPVCYEESRSAAELKYVAENQRGIMDFLESYVDGMYQPDSGGISPELADKLYSFISLDYTDEECRAKDGLMRDDGLCLGRQLWAENIHSTRR
jgi:hypothetical protein